MLLGGLALLVSGVAFLPSARAQNIYLRDGQLVETNGLRRDAATVLASIKTKEGSQGELGYAVVNIARIDFPEPPQLKNARDLLSAGKAEEAVRQLTPIVAYYAPFRDIPGNWWEPLALLQVDALGRTGRDHDQDLLLADLGSFGNPNPDMQRELRIMQGVATERRGDHRKALTQLEPIVNDLSLPPDSLTDAWLAVGSARLALRDYRVALLAFSHIPVYTPDRPTLMQPALLGSASALVGLDDGQRARIALEDLIAAYPNSPEAAQAKDRLQKLALPPPKAVGG